MKRNIVLCMLMLSTLVQARVFTVTAYCPCEKCCGKYAKMTNNVVLRDSVEGATVAGPRWMKRGTILRIQGLKGERVVVDRLATKFDSRIDLFFLKHQDAVNWGKRKLNVEIVAP